MNMFLDENWKEVYEEISKPGVDATVSQLVDVINMIHKIAPFEEMFPETLP
jgi:Haemolymph juvenile hormone binding protein (JHBP).